MLGALQYTMPATEERIQPRENELENLLGNYKAYRRTLTRRSSHAYFGVIRRSLLGLHDERREQYTHEMSELVSQESDTLFRDALCALVRDTIVTLPADSRERCYDTLYAHLQHLEETIHNYTARYGTQEAAARDGRFRYHSERRALLQSWSAAERQCVATAALLREVIGVAEQPTRVGVLLDRYFTFQQLQESSN